MTDSTPFPLGSAHRRRGWCAGLLSLCLTACGGDSEGESTVPADAGSAGDGAVEGDGGSTRSGDGGAALPPLTRNAVSGDLTYAALTPEGGHLFSMQRDGGLKQRLTGRPGAWSAHAVGPDPRFIVAVRHQDANVDGRPDEGSTGEAWIIDVKSATEYPISPPECDVDPGGIGWRDPVQVVLAMSCNGEPSQAYLGAMSNTGRVLNEYLAVTDHPEAVREVFPAVGTPYITYVVDTVVEGVTKPTVWLAETLTTRRCQVTSGDSDFLSTAPDGLVGDRWPAFNHTLTRIGFSRNTREPATGPRGHLDAFSVAVSFNFGDAGCGNDLTNLSDLLRSERYPTDDGEQLGDELMPQLSAGRGGPGELLFAGEAAGQTHHAAIYLADTTGTVSRLSEPGEAAWYPRWIVTAFDLSGER